MKIARASSLIAILGLLFCIQHIALADSQERKVDTARPAATPLDHEAAQDIVKLTLIDSMIQGRGLVVARVRYDQKKTFAGKITVFVDPPFAVRSQRKRDRSTAYISGNNRKSTGVVKIAFELDCANLRKPDDADVIVRYKIHAKGVPVRGKDPVFGPALAEVSKSYLWQQICGGNNRANSGPTPELSDSGQSMHHPGIVAPTSETVVFPNLNPEKPGWASRDDTDLFDRCVPNVPLQFEGRLHNGRNDYNILAYRTGGYGAPTLENAGFHDDGIFRNHKHRQGIARYFADGRNYFYVSNSVVKNKRVPSNSLPSWPPTATVEVDTGHRAGVEVIAWSGAGQAGQLGSNIDGDYRQAPGPQYRIVNYVAENFFNADAAAYIELGSKYVSPDRTNHGGGIQVYGRYLAVPYFAEKDYIRIYDLEDPKNPTIATTLVSENAVQFGFAAMTRLNNGRYLVIGGDSELEVFVTAGNSPASGWEPHSVVSPAQDSPDNPIHQWSQFVTDWPGDPKYQGAQFVTDCDGTLYLVFSRKTKSSIDRYKDDYFEVWRVRVLPNSGRYDIDLNLEFKKHMYCGGGSGSLWCNFVAGVGVYIDPRTGNLLAYGIEHWNHGPAVNGIRSTKMKEFRQK